MATGVTDYRLHGVRIVHADELDPNTPQTPGMSRAAAINAARTGAEKLWAGTVVVNLDLPDIDPPPEQVQWVDDMHPPQ